MINLIHNRREFLKFMGRTSGAALSTGFVAQFLTACSSLPQKINPMLPFAPLKPSFADDLSLVEGLNYRTLLMWNTYLNKRGDAFGYNNDYTAFIPISANDALLWVNHEYPSPFFINGINPTDVKTKAHVDKERKAVGGSIVRIKRNNINEPWGFILNDPQNRRLDGTTRIPFVGGKVLGSTHAIGTLGNCAGGVTSWRTILTCEENYDNYYGEVSYDDSGERKLDTSVSVYKWQEHYPLPPEHYGWVVEVNPMNGQAKKHLALGRFAHECATTTLAADGRTVVYMGDDKDDECVY
ncbi:MAG: alkaline phosphatase PhoX, partial [Bdellovibrionota bacterium]